MSNRPPAVGAGPVGRCAPWITGRIQQDRCVAKNARRRTAVKVIAEEVAPALRFPIAEVSKTADAAVVPL